MISCTMRSPLIGEDWPDIPMENGIQRYARFKPIFADQKLPSYTPQTYRKGNS